MRTYFTFLFVLLVSISSVAQSPAELLTPTQHLLAINAQWEHNSVQEKTPISFRNDTERIGFHIAQVVAQLEAREIHDDKLSKRRNVLIRTLRVYGQAGLFPVNTGHTARTPYFIDDSGTACAVGHLMIASGHEELALRIQSEHNYDYIADIKTEGVADWAAEYGLTLDELALIQPAYAPTNQMSNVGAGVNGPITCMSAFLDERLYIAGDFDQMDGAISCTNGFGYYEDDAYHCVDNVPTGTIHEMKRLNSYDLMVIGELIYEGTTYPAAIYSDDIWNYISLPNRPNAIGKTIDYSYNPENRYVLSIDPQDGSGTNEIWKYFDGIIGVWDKLVTTDGPILCSSEQSYNYIGGDFDTYIDHTASDIEVTCSGLIQFDFYAPSQQVIPYYSEFLPDEITTLLHVGEILYIGGTCDQIYPNTYLTRLQNNTFQALDYREEAWGQVNVGLYDIAAYGDNQLLVAGDMVMNDFGTIGNNLGMYDLLSGYLIPMVSLDAPVHSISSFEGDWYIGGDFTSNVGISLAHIAKLGGPTGLFEEEQVSMTLSPNPATEHIDIRFDEPMTNLKSMQVFSLDGKEQFVPNHFASNSLRLEVISLSPGVYIYRLEMDGGSASGRFVKE